MSSILSPGEDHGLGIEVVDRANVIAEAAIDPQLEERVRQTRRKGPLYWIIASIALILLAEQTSFDFLLYNPILGELATKFETSDIVWVMTAVSLAGAVTLPLFTRLADIYGKRRIQLIAGTISIIGCVVCALAPTFTILIVGRALMAAGLCFGVLGILIVREVFPVRARAIVVAVVVNGAGFIIVGGPLLSGWLVQSWGVAAPFWFQGIVCALSLVLMMALVPESPVRVQAKVDYLGALLLGAGSFCFLIGLGEVTSLGWTAFTLGFALAGVVLLLAWIFQLRVAREPLVNLRLIKSRPILAPTISRMFLNAAVGLVNVLVVLMWTTPSAMAPYGRDLTPLDVAVWSIPFAALTVAGGIVVGLTVRSIGYRVHMVISGICWVAACLLFAFNIEGSSVTMIAIYALAGFGCLFMAAGASLVLIATPSDQRGIASGVSLSVSSLGQGVAQVLVFAVLSTSIATVVGGVAIYSESAYRNAFLITAVVAALGLITALLIPHGRRQAKPAGEDRLSSDRIEAAEIDPVG